MRRICLLLIPLLAACGDDAGSRVEETTASEMGTSAAARVEPGTAPPATAVTPTAASKLDTIPGSIWTEADWEIFRRAVLSAEAGGVAEMPLGEAIGRIGRGFVGFPYTPQTLEAPWIEAEAEGRPMDGSLERLVVNLREFDCVTFVENVLALTRFVRERGAAALDDPERARAAYEAELVALRYRGADMAGYASRLHYFSEWLSDNAARGRLALVHPELDPGQDAEPIDFMTTHVEAYPALADDPASVARIREVEVRLNEARPRSYVPEDRIAAIADRIRTGDVIAATSTVDGLDVAHTGIAIRVDGELHLMHAPLVGSVVEISEVPLAERILRIEGQDGILVGRPVER